MLLSLPPSLRSLPVTNRSRFYACCSFTVSQDQPRPGHAGGATLWPSAPPTVNAAPLFWNGAGVANIIRRVLEVVPVPALSQPIWTLPPERHLPLFKQVLKRIGVQSLELTPAGLRGGGATDFWLRTRDVPALRRRGRWSNEKTLECYIQEGAYFLGTTSLPASARLNALVELAPVLLASAPLPPPSPTPTFLKWGCLSGQFRLTSCVGQKRKKGR